MNTTAQEYEAASRSLTAVLDGVPQDRWTDPSPCDGWSARDVVGHLIETQRDFLTGHGVDLGAAILAAKDSGLLIAGGGHAMAAGLTLPTGGLEPLRAFLHERLAAGIETSRDGRALLLDALLTPGGVAAALCDALDAAGPYGAGWPAPRVAAGPARLIKTGIVGDGHVRGLACGEDGKSFKWIAFRSAATELGQALLASPGDQRWWLAGTIKRDEYNGGNAAEMHLEDAAVA